MIRNMKKDKRSYLGRPPIIQTRSVDILLGTFAMARGN
jgi:hypothetical protein